MGIRKTLHRILGSRLQQGFTLVELVVVLGIIGILLLGLITTFNPLEQYKKAQDSTREHDLGQIQRALDAYFNDKGCYPTTLAFGSKWSSGSQVFMEKVPEDPTCSTDRSKCYVYEVDTSSSCPQWNVLYASLQSSTPPSNACPLAIRSQSGTSCVPSNYSAAEYNYCAISGDIDCSVVSAYTIPVVTPTAGPGSTATPTPTPPSGGLSCPGNQYYGCTGDNRCNSIAPATQCSQNGGSVYCYCDQHCNQSCTFN